MKLLSRFGLFVLVFLIAVNLFAQTTPGSLIGTVSSQGNPVPGVMVTISSPDLQGTRSTVTGDAGGYRFAALPPGEYTVVFELEGMQKINKRVTVSLAQTARADAEMRVAAIGESLTVTAAAPAVVETAEISANFDAQTVRELPTSRDIESVLLLAPGVSDGAVNDQIVISGAMSFDNLFLVDGVVVNENLRGRPHELYIEDAVKETTVLTGGISAEYGRFTGGVVSTLTKSGGNDFSGSFRDSLGNPSWTAKTDYPGQVDNIDELNETYEGTLGGRILRDRLWFFGAGRYEDRKQGAQLALTELPYTSTFKRRRYEAYGSDHTEAQCRRHIREDRGSSDEHHHVRTDRRSAEPGASRGAEATLRLQLQRHPHQQSVDRRSVQPHGSRSVAWIGNTRSRRRNVAARFVDRVSHVVAVGLRRAVRHQAARQQVLAG
jgi:hypothetical protein